MNTTTRFFKNADGTVADNKLNVDWSITLMSGKDRPFAEAEKAVTELGEDWRFPTVDELFSLVDRSSHAPAINTEFFPDTKNDLYWTDEKAAFRSSDNWVVNFYYGSVAGFYLDADACVRAVRPRK